MNRSSSRPAYRNRYDSLPTLLLPKVHLPQTSRSKHRLLYVITYAFLCIFTLLITLCLLPFLLPISLIFRIYRNILISKIEKRHGSDAIVMPGTDAMWLQDTATNPAVINCVMFMNGSLDVDRFSNVIKERMVDIVDPENSSKKWFPKLTKYPTQILHRYTWLEEESFDISDHVFKYHKCMPDTREELEMLIGEIATTPLRRMKSPWQFVLVPPNPAKPEDYVALFKVHHSIADGVSLVKVLVQQLIDKMPREFSAKRSFGSKGKWNKILKAIFEGPLMIIQRFLFLADKHVLHGKTLTGQKLVSWSDPIDISLVKKMKNVTGTTVNDVLISCLGAAFRDYIMHYDESCPKDILAYVPVNLRKPSESSVLDNQFVLVFLQLPTHTDDPLEQLAHTRKRMTEIKLSPEPIINSLIMRYCMARLPNWMTHLTFDMFARKCSLIVSNIPGPQEKMTMSGELIEEIMFWPPCRANVGLGVSILSYAGNVRMGLMCDKALLSNPSVLVDRFAEQVNKLAARLNVDKED